MGVIETVIGMLARVALTAVLVLALVSLLVTLVGDAIEIYKLIKE